MADTIRAAGMRHPGFEDDAEGEKVAQIALEAIQRGAGPRYRAVLLDEAQDFGTNALRFVVGLLELGYDDLVIVADAAQNIFRRKFSWRQAGIQAQGRTRILRKNYRNTKEILEFASRFLLASTVLRPDEVPDPEDGNAVIPPESAARNGSRPVLHVVEDVRAEIARVIDQVKNWVDRASQPRTLAVLYASSGITARRELEHFTTGCERPVSACSG
jgi:superfamily I DNA/RNA helicase